MTGNSEVESRREIHAEGDPADYCRRFERLARLADIVKLSDDDAAWIYPDVSIADVPELILGFGPRLETPSARRVVLRSVPVARGGLMPPLKNSTEIDLKLLHAPGPQTLMGRHRSIGHFQDRVA